MYQTWTRPEYSVYITYPHCLYFLELLISNPSFGRELGQVNFRNFCHEQQYYAWQHRFVKLYGSSGNVLAGTAADDADAAAQSNEQSNENDDQEDT